MSYSFIDIPHFVPSEKYEITIKKLIVMVKKEPSVSAIYRLGNVNHPGISDIDLLVVFKDATSCVLNPREQLNEKDKYLLTHEVAGASETLFSEVLPFVFWDNLNCIWSESEATSASTKVWTPEEEKLLKRQIAMEFLIKLFIELSIQQKYGVIKLRSILQEIKGLRYDLQFLDIYNQDINKMMKEFLEMLDEWFTKPFEPKTFSIWLKRFSQEIQKTLLNLSEQNIKLWLPEERAYPYGKNVVLSKGNDQTLKFQGLFLPSYFISKNKRIFNAHRRLNSFAMNINFTTEDQSGLFQQRMDNFKRYKEFNRTHFPHFGAMYSSLIDQFI